MKSKLALATVLALSGSAYASLSEEEIVRMDSFSYPVVMGHERTSEIYGMPGDVMSEDEDSVLLALGTILPLCMSSSSLLSEESDEEVRELFEFLDSFDGGKWRYLFDSNGAIKTQYLG